MAILQFALPLQIITGSNKAASIYFISRLIGNPGQQVRFKMPKTLEDALKTAVIVYEAERQEKRNETFYARSAKRCEKCNIFAYISQQCHAKFQLKDRMQGSGL